MMYMFLCTIRKRCICSCAQEVSNDVYVPVYNEETMMYNYAHVYDEETMMYMFLCTMRKQ